MSYTVTANKKKTRFIDGYIEAFISLKPAICISLIQILI